jgi:hypothetical protein
MKPSTIVSRAPWGRSLRAVSFLATALLLGIALLEAFAIPRHLLGGWPWAAATFLPLLILFASLLFAVRSYSLENNMLRVRRLFWHTDISLNSLTSAWASPEAMSGSLRLFGNGGLYSITGIFRNARLGTYRAFATDPRCAVVLELSPRKVVITPEDPDSFVRHLQPLCPSAVTSNRS